MAYSGFPDHLPLPKLQDGGFNPEKEGQNEMSSSTASNSDDNAIV
jgi:hypothetical protein